VVSVEWSVEMIADARDPKWAHTQPLWTVDAATAAHYTPRALRWMDDPSTGSRFDLRRRRADPGTTIPTKL